MPWTAIHQSDQLKRAMSNGPPPKRILSAEPTRKETFRIPLSAAYRRAVAILVGSGSTATTLEANGASSRVSLPSPHPISRMRRPRSGTKRSMIRTSIPGGGKSESGELNRYACSNAWLVLGSTLFRAR